MDVSGINNNLTDYLTTSNEQKTKDDAFVKLLEDAKTKQDDAKLKSACEQYEAYFIKQMFSEMRKTVPDSGLIENSSAMKTYQGMLDDEYSKSAAKGEGIGLAKALYLQLSKANKIVPSNET